MTSDQLFHQVASSPAQENFPQSLYDGLLKGFGIAPVGEKAAPPPPNDCQPLKAAPTTSDIPHDKIPLPPHRPVEFQVPDNKTLADRTLHAIAAADGSKMAEPSKDAQTVVKHFLSEKDHTPEKDKAALLKKYAPAFEKAITEADTSYAAVDDKTRPAIKAAQEGYIENYSAFADSYNLARHMSKDLPANQKEMAGHLLDQIGMHGKIMPPEEDLKRAFADQPQFLQMLKELTNNQKDLMGAQDRLDSATKPLLDAAQEQDRTRLAYERAAQSVGNTSMAKSIDAERNLLQEQTNELTYTPIQVRKITRA